MGGEATELLGALTPRLPTCVDAQVLRDMQTRVYDFNFDEAVVLLRELIN